MNKKILIGSIIAVVLLTLVSFSSVVGYSSVKSNPSNTIITDESDSYTPIILVLQLIAKLRNHKDIQNIETEDDVLRIIEGDEELNSIVEQLSGDDCGCEDDNPTWERIWPFPIICLLLWPLVMISVLGYFRTDIVLPALIMGILGEIFNCSWGFLTAY